jgi:hypothetical protein
MAADTVLGGRPVRSRKSCQREALAQAQGVEHELERQVAPRHLAFLCHGGAGQRPVHVQLGLAVPHLAHHPVREAQLAVRAGADAQVVAELPVVQVVHAAVAGRA